MTDNFGAAAWYAANADNYLLWLLIGVVAIIVLVLTE